MNGGVRTGLSLLAVAFTAYLASGALMWLGLVDAPVLLIAAVALYLVTTWLCVFWGARPAVPVVTDGPTVSRRTVLPAWACVLALAAVVIVPSATWVAVGADARLAAYATWSLGGLGALLTIVMVRRRPVVAWIGVALLGVSAAAWIGIPSALTLGFVGAVVWVTVAQLLTGLVDRAAADTVELTELQRRSSEWLAAQTGRRRERRIRVHHALEVAGPVLVRTIESGGALTEDEKVAARLAEGELRDELRGPRLIDADVRARLLEARRRGSAVTVLDEGGLDGVGETELHAIRAELARALDGARSDRIYIRTSPHESVAVTVVGRSRPVGADEETVDLWHEIPHPSSAD